MQNALRDDMSMRPGTFVEYENLRLSDAAIESENLVYMHDPIIETFNDADIGLGQDDLLWICNGHHSGF